MGAVSTLPVAWRLVFSLLHGVAIASFFIIGHDCVHNAFFEGRRKNRFWGRIAYGFCWHSISLWKVVHNINHHGRTNLKGVDDVWAPFSLKEFREAPAWRRLLERVYRGPFGHLIYYQTQYLYPKLVLPIHPMARGRWRTHMSESVFVLMFGAVLILSWLGASIAMGGVANLGSAFLFGALIPFVFWNALTSFTIYIQHTNPQVHWFENEEDWSHLNGQIRGTVDTVMPFPIAPLYSEVLRHTAHHDNPTIPVYRLPQSQDRLNRKFSTDITTASFGFAWYWRTLKACKLYDFERRCWTDFSGQQTSPTYFDRFEPRPNPFAEKLDQDRKPSKDVA